MQWPIAQFPTRHVYNPRAAGGTGFVTLSAVNPANTKGSYATLASGTTYAGTWVYLNTGAIASSGTDTSAVLDIAFGTAGNETIVVADLLFGFRRKGGLLLPLYVPAGATVRGRIASDRGSIGYTGFSLDVYGGEPDSGLTAPGKITTYGVTAASSSGTTVTPNATINTKGSYAQLAASASAPIHALLIAVQGSSAGLATNVTYNIDIAVGGAGAETPIVRDHIVEVNSTEEMVPYTHEFVPLALNIPTGTRLSARCSANVASSVAIEVGVYGFTY